MSNARVGTVEDDELVVDKYGNYPVSYPENTIIKCPDGSIWYVDDDRDWVMLGRGSGELRGPAPILNLPGLNA